MRDGLSDSNSTKEQMTAESNESPSDAMIRLTSDMLNAMPAGSSEALDKLKEAAASLCVLPETLYANQATRTSGMILAMLISTRLVPLLENFDAEKAQL